MGALNILANVGKTADKAEGALPLMLGRATPKTQAEIDALATRVARQMNEEHVRAPKKTSNLAGKSLKESQRLKDLNYSLKPTGAAQPSVVYQAKKGDVNVALPGDQTVSDMVLQSVGDIEGINSTQQGGALYGLGKLKLKDPLFWASNEGPAQLFQNKVDKVAGFYDPNRVVGQHLAMGPISNNFAMHFADANLRAMDLSKISPKQMQTFDSLIAHGYYKKNAKTGAVEHIKFDDWPGIADPEGALVAMRNNSELRKWFNNRMKTPDVTQPLGLPNGRDIEWAITQPELRNMEVNLTGLSAGEMVPGASLTDTAAHNTYSKGIRGTALGHQEVLTPFTLSYPDAAQHIASTQRPQDFTGTIQKVFPHQIVDEQYLDEMGRYRDLIKKYTGKKKGGLTLKASGGLIKAQLKALREEFAAKDAVIKAQQALDEKKYLKDIEANTLTPENIQKKVEETKPQKFDEGGAAFGKFPQMSLKRRKQDREASKNVPVDLVRGAISGVLGAPGDVESLVRMLPGFNEKTILPTSEDIEKRLPFKSDTPVSRAATGVGQIAGGFYTGPGSPFKLIGVLPAAVKHGAEEFAKASAMGVPHVVKPKGGNWLSETEGRFKSMSPYPDYSKRIEKLKSQIASMENAGTYSRQTIENAKDDLLAIERDQAVNNWTTRNLGNYVKKEMGTPDDPVRKLAEEGIVHAPHRDFIDNEGNIGIANERKRLGFPAEGMGQSPDAKAWEEISDFAIKNTQAKKIQGADEDYRLYQEAKAKADDIFADINEKFDEMVRSTLPPGEADKMVRLPFKNKAQTLGREGEYDAALKESSKMYQESNAGRSDMLEANPWVAKLDPEERLYTGYFGDLGFDHIIDVLREDVRAGRIRPDQLSKVSMDQAVRRTYEYDLEMAKKMEHAGLTSMEGFPVHKQYPGGYKWIELALPKKPLPEGYTLGGGNDKFVFDPSGKDVPHPNIKALEDALRYEGDTMGHCVGGYCPDVLEGRSRIYSLRDEKGMPHVTVEVQPPRGISQSEAADQAKKEGLRGQEFAGRVFDLMEGKGLPPQIVQIKGKQNKAPIEDYLPYVQDFVRGGEWSRVGDLYNTGLRDIENTPNLKKWLQERGVEHPRYLTEKEYGAHESDFLLDRLKPEEGMKAGGMITSLRRNRKQTESVTKRVPA